MSQLSIYKYEDIKNIDFYQQNFVIPITIQISKLETLSVPRKCSIDSYHIILDHYINSTNKVISEKYYFNIYEFLTGDNIDLKLKEKIFPLLDDNAKDYVFKKFVENILKNKFKKDYDDISGILWYRPKRNKVPIKNCSIQYDSLVRNEVMFSFDQFNNIIENKGSSIRNDELLSLHSLFNEFPSYYLNFFPDYVIDIINLYSNNQFIQFENDLFNSYDTMIRNDLENQNEEENKIHINESLEEQILSKIPSNFSLLEKTIYIYSKLCQILSYDSLYYTDKKTKDRIPISSITTYDSENNGVVCYEFSYIFEDLLEKIGVKYIKKVNTPDDKFENAHANITYMVDDIVVFADSTRTIVDGDLSTLKFSTELDGIRCELYSKDSQDTFKDAKEKVRMQLINENDTYKNLLPSKKEISGLSINDTLLLFNELLINSNLTNVDFISYANKLISLMDLKISTSVICDNNMPIKFYLKINIFDYYGYNQLPLVSYVIDSVSKEIFDEIPIIPTFEETVTFKH